MNLVLWIVQIVLAVLEFAGGAYKMFGGQQLTNQFQAVSRPGWCAFGVVEVLGAVLLIVPAAVGWMPSLTPWAAVVLAVEASALAVIYARQSLALTAANPLPWSVVMALAAAFVAYGRWAQSPSV
jgi:hypothetical protein